MFRFKISEFLITYERVIWLCSNLVRENQTNHQLLFIFYFFHFVWPGFTIFRRHTEKCTCTSCQIKTNCWLRRVMRSVRELAVASADEKLSVFTLRQKGRGDSIFFFFFFSKAWLNPRVKTIRRDEEVDDVHRPTAFYIKWVIPPHCVSLGDPVSCKVKLTDIIFCLTCESCGGD